MTLVLAVVLALPLAAGHVAPDPPEYMTRILHDWQDDWGSDEADTSPGDGHDLIALDLREEHNSTLGENALVLRLSLNRGWDRDVIKPELREAITFKARGQAVTREFKTSDNARFTSDFDAFAGPFPILTSTGSKDGQRFYVEGVIKWSTLKLGVGDRVSDFFVQGYAGGQKADNMVGGSHVGGQPVSTKPPGDDVSYRRSEYALRGPVMYATSSIDKTTLTVKPSENRTITWTITNSLGSAQTVTVRSTAPTGVDVGLHGKGFSKESLTFSLQAGVTATIHAYVLPQTGAASGDLDLSYQTSLGGRNTHHVMLTVPGSTATETGPAGSSPTDSKGAPGPSLVVCLGLLIVGALIGRRGR